MAGVSLLLALGEIIILMLKGRTAATNEFISSSRTSPRSFFDLKSDLFLFSFLNFW